MDAVFVDGVSKDDLDLEAVRRYMRKAVREGRRIYSEDEDPWSVLKKLKWRMGTARMDCRRRDDSDAVSGEDARTSLDGRQGTGLSRTDEGQCAR